MSWKELSRARRAKQLDSIPKDWLLKEVPTAHNVIDVPTTCGLLTARELEITNTIDIEALLLNLANGIWSSVEVTTAFYKRAIIAHQLTNCLTEIFVEDALKRAAALDEHLARTGTPVGPLHGLPVSLKDQFCMKGLETIMGYASWIGKVADHDAALVTILYEAGANPFVRTNVPQALWWGETFNSVFGRTLNPYNRALTCGGSSGGEGALLAMRGSPIGVGSDIGGSVRIPTAFCNLYALRPSMHRLPYGGLMNAGIGQESIHSVMGPMSSSLSALRVFTKTVIDAKPWEIDPTCLRIPWDAKQSALGDHGGPVGRLCFAIMWDDGVVGITPPIRRALEMTKKALEDAGHIVVDWENHKHLEIHINTHQIFGADGGEDVALACEPTGEPIIGTMLPSPTEGEEFNYLFGPNVPSVADELLKLDPIDVPMERHVLDPRNVTKEAIDELKRHYPKPTEDGEEVRFDEGPEAAEVDHETKPPKDADASEDKAKFTPGPLASGADVPPKTAFELWQLHAQRRNIQKEYLDHWNATRDKTGTGRPVDAIISPVAAYPAPPHGYNSDAFYTSLWNGLDYTACTFPVTTVDPELDVRVPRHQFHNHEDEHVYRWYDPHIFTDAPVGLQLVGRTHEEEAVLAMTEVVDTALKRAHSAK